MTRAELGIRLAERGITPAAYSLDGGLPSEKYVLEQRINDWAVYYSEKGQKTGERTFDGEEAACHYILDLLTNDPSTHAT
jgi:hypothetical protein